MTCREGRGEHTQTARQPKRAGNKISLIERQASDDNIEFIHTEDLIFCYINNVPLLNAR